MLESVGLKEQIHVWPSHKVLNLQFAPLLHVFTFLYMYLFICLFIYLHYINYDYLFAEDDGPELPTKVDQEFRPFIRRLPEFKFW